MKYPPAVAGSLPALGLTCCSWKAAILDEVELKRVFCEGPDIAFYLAALFSNQNFMDHPEANLLVNGPGDREITRSGRPHPPYPNAPGG